MAEYPKRMRFFAFRFCRLLAKQAVANEIGSDACWLLTTIAHLEDAKGYRPVTYFNPSLADVLGCGSVESLDRIRRRAIASGWLHYEAGAKRRAGVYWVLIPPRFCGRINEKQDQDEPDILPQKCGRNGQLEQNTSADTSRILPQPCGKKREVSEKKARTKRELSEKKARSKCGTFNPSPNPSPNPYPNPSPNPNTKDGVVTPSLSPDGDGDKLPMAPSEFVERWNRWSAQHGFPSIRKLTEGRRKKIKIRLGQDGWLEDFKEALRRLPIPGEGWQPDLDWFIRAEVNVSKILEGKYDWRGGKAAGEFGKNQSVLDSVLEEFADDEQTVDAQTE